MCSFRVQTSPRVAETGWLSPGGLKMVQNEPNRAEPKIGRNLLMVGPLKGPFNVIVWGSTVPLMVVLWYQAP